jgi:integrase
MAITILPKKKQICADIRVHGQRKRKVFPNTPTGNLRAINWIAAMKSEKPNLPGTTMEWRSFADALDFYCLRTKFTSLDPVTQKKYRYRLTEFVNFAAGRGKEYMHEFTQSDAEAYGNYIIGKNKGKGREGRLLLASDLFRIEIDRDDASIIKNPFRSVKKSGYGTDTEIKFIEEDTFYEILEHATERERAVIIILYTTGMRTQELEQLRKSNVSKDQTVIERKVTGGNRWLPKGNKEATIPHDKVTHAAYQALYSLNPPGDWVLCGDRPAGKGHLEGLFRRMRYRLKKTAPHIEHFTAHSFRRTLGTHLAEKGVRAEIVQKILRHTDIRTTLKYYVKITPKLVREGISPVQTGRLVKISRELKSKRTA